MQSNITTGSSVLVMAASVPYLALHGLLLYIERWRYSPAYAYSHTPLGACFLSAATKNALMGVEQG